MNANALQGERDKRTPTVAKAPKIELPIPAKTTPPMPAAQQPLADKLGHLESLCQQLRYKALNNSVGVKDALAKPSLLCQFNVLENDVEARASEQRPATMNDLQKWNIREMRVCLEWAKSLDGFQKLSEEDQVRHSHREY